ncbi:MAG: hypothetical protein KF864_15500 [Phycisphaeraceae bacterium]|nr:hypothetical protein [Phycisphaeraceae bacterium]
MWIVFWMAVLTALYVLHVIDKICPATDLSSRVNQFMRGHEENRALDDAVQMTISSVRLTERGGGLHVEIVVVNESDRRFATSVHFTSPALFAMLSNLTSEDGRVWTLTIPTNEIIRVQYDHDPLEITVAPRESISIRLFAPSVSIREKSKPRLSQNPPALLAFSVKSITNPGDVTDAETGEAVDVMISGAGACTFKRE